MAENSVSDQLRLFILRNWFLPPLKKLSLGGWLVVIVVMVVVCSLMIMVAVEVIVVVVFGVSRK